VDPDLRVMLVNNVKSLLMYFAIVVFQFLAIMNMFSELQSVIVWLLVLALALPLSMFILRQSNFPSLLSVMAPPLFIILFALPSFIWLMHGQPPLVIDLFFGPLFYHFVLIDYFLASVINSISPGLAWSYYSDVPVFILAFVTSILVSAMFYVGLEVQQRWLQARTCAEDLREE